MAEFVPQPPAQYAKRLPYVIIVAGVTIYEGEDYEDALRALLAFEKSEEYRHSVIKFFAYDSKLEVLPMRPDIRPNALV